MRKLLEEGTLEDKAHPKQGAGVSESPLSTLEELEQVLQNL
jgi:hypothetical protein